MLTQINYELQKANIISPTVKSSSLYGSLALTILEAIDTVNNLGKDYWLNKTNRFKISSLIKKSPKNLNNQNP